MHKPPPLLPPALRNNPKIQYLQEMSIHKESRKLIILQAGECSAIYNLDNSWSWQQLGLNRTRKKRTDNLNNSYISIFKVDSANKMCKIFNFSLKTTKVLDLLQGVAKSEEGQVTSTVKVKNEQHKLLKSVILLS